MYSVIEEVAPGRPIGESYGGGFYAGRIKIGANTYELIVSPKDGGENNLSYSSWGFDITTNDPINDGWQIRTNQIEDWLPNYMAQEVFTRYTIGGFNDWYMPSKEEMEIIYRAFKPTTANNVTTSGVNGSSIPATSNYTATNPAQTSVALFKAGGSEAFDADTYYSASRSDVGGATARTKSFLDGSDSYDDSTNGHRVRAIRRILVT